MKRCRVDADGPLSPKAVARIVARHIFPRFCLLRLSLNVLLERSKLIEIVQSICILGNIVSDLYLYIYSLFVDF